MALLCRCVVPLGATALIWVAKHPHPSTFLLLLCSWSGYSPISYTSSLLLYPWNFCRPTQAGLIGKVQALLCFLIICWEINNTDLQTGLKSLIWNWCLCFSFLWVFDITDNINHKRIDCAFSHYPHQVRCGLWGISPSSVPYMFVWAQKEIDCVHPWFSYFSQFHASECMWDCR